MRQIHISGGLDEFRARARTLLAEEVQPEAVDWLAAESEQASLFGALEESGVGTSSSSTSGDVRPSLEPAQASLFGALDDSGATTSSSSTSDDVQQSREPAQASLEGGGRARQRRERAPSYAPVPESRPATARESQPATAPSYAPVPESQPVPAPESQPATARKSPPAIAGESQPATARKSQPATARKSPPATARKSQPATARVPPAFLALCEAAACHRSSSRWALLYRVLWRVTHGSPRLLEDAADADVIRLHALARAVEKDEHRMHAFVRFRRIEDEQGEVYVAWYQPDHRVLERAAPFFARRFAAMRWSILTPDGSAHWDGANLRFGPGAARDAAPEGDALESLWRTYYAHTFNPARLNVRLMKAELPPRFWRDLPEAADIPKLVGRAPSTAHALVTPVIAPSAATAFLPRAVHDLPALSRAASACTACPLHARATQTVFGEGPVNARVVLVGEQPGDQEDRAGRPFIGPAGELLDQLLAEAGISREEVYLTNAVKHFHWTGEEKRRIHQRPGRREVLACRAWLDAELEALSPEIVVALGATAAQSMLGPGFKLTHSRGRFFATPHAPAWIATWHPSAVLRTPDPRTRERARSELIEDLRQVAARLRG